jgi:hypothetical protein
MRILAAQKHGPVRLQGAMSVAFPDTYILLRYPVDVFPGQLPWTTPLFWRKRRLLRFSDQRVLIYPLQARSLPLLGPYPPSQGLQAVGSSNDGPTSGCQGELDQRLANGGCLR